MLKKLKIENFVLIDYQEMEFENNINVLTGDTGSGKSVIINSIKFLFGMRAKSELFFNKEKNVVVTGIIKTNEKIVKKLIAHHIEVDEEIEVMRILSPNLRNKVRINGELVNINILQDVFNEVITIYSQYSVAKFKTEKKYLEIVDNVSRIQNELADFKQEYIAYANLNQKLNLLKEELITKEERKEILHMRLKQLDDIDESKTFDDVLLEREELEIKFENIRLNLKTKTKFDIITNELNDLIALIDNEHYLQRLNKAIEEIDEVNFNIAKNTEEIDEKYLNYLNDYISMCKRIARKYNIDINELSAYKNQLKDELDNLDSIELDVMNFESKVKLQYEKTYKIAQKISQKRKNSIPKLEQEINSRLKKLSLIQSDFKVELAETDLNNNGIDKCIFTIKMNDGGQYTAIDQTASGGEIARFLLAVEAFNNQYEKDNFIIFDEIDTGVSGHVASEMGALMRSIAKHNKLLIVTHLAQIAAISETHYEVSKIQKDNNTVTSLKLIEDEQKPLILAKIISGFETNNEAIMHAKKLLSEHQ